MTVYPSRSGERGPSRATKATEAIIVAEGSANIARWNPGNVGFFNPIYEDKSVTSNTTPIKYIPKETYFRNIHLFLEYARDIISIKKDNLVRTNL